jgi:hypothetical protein
MTSAKLHHRRRAKAAVVIMFGVLCKQLLVARGWTDGICPPCSRLAAHLVLLHGRYAAVIGRSFGRLQQLNFDWHPVRFGLLTNYVRCRRRRRHINSNQ